MKPMFESLILELTNACNFRCPFCPSESITRPKGFMSMDVFRRIVREGVEGGFFDTIQLGLMGEPFMHKGLFEMAAHASEAGLTVRCFTNGSLLSAKNIDRWAESRIDELYISYRGIDPEAFSSLSSMNHEAYVAGIRELLTRAASCPERKVILKCFKPSLVDSLVQTGAMAKDMKAAQSADYVNRLLESIGLEARVKHSAAAFHDTVRLSPSLSVRLESIARWNDIPDTSKGGRFHHGLVGACDGMRGHIGVLWNGDVTTCCKDYDGRNVMGNVCAQPLGDILSGPEATRFRKLMRWCVLPTPYCRVCRGGETLKDSLVNQLGSIAYFRTPFFGWKGR
ncbi:radical SAM/SPASM domain-containing protein [Fundidesulfovibrio soli]|uniref:radical SAM/SPASM domain-containing protein n=1 Tax=Fundidesulfovibrio soli TaxID=2922716 RepID=UPI001FAF9672|nr:radical SAM protein [Fundidesulfovibrio soli]